MSKKDHEFAVFIGRFQPPHKRHIEAMRHGLSAANKLIIVLGSARAARNIKNPFTTAEREEMIRVCFSQEENNNIVFRTVRDYYYNDNNWIADVQTKVADVSKGSHKICLLGRNKDHTSYYLDLFPQWKREQTKDGGTLNATDIRNSYFNKDIELVYENYKDSLDKNVFDYLELWRNRNKDIYTGLAEEWDFINSYKTMWKQAPYPVTFTTTDAVVVKSGHVLVIKRKFNPGKGLLALPGGFLQQNKTLFDSALSELKEETRIMMPKEALAKCLKASKVFDHPGRSLRGRTVTHGYYFELPPGGDLPQVKGDDDAEHAMWIPIADAFARENEFYEDHLQIIQWFYGRGDDK